MESKTPRGMKSGICPICSSSEIYSGADVQFKSGRNNVIPVTLWDFAEMDNYVCVECGYVESYIADRSRLNKIKEKWPKVK